MNRLIGIRPRVKMKKDGTPSPTEVTIIDGETKSHYKLEDEQSELDFIFGKFPVSWVDATKKQVKSTIEQHVRPKRGNKDKFQIPDAYEGMRAGDTVVMSLGGSGDLLAFAASRRGEEVGFKVMRCQPFRLKEARGDDDKVNDSELIATLYQLNPSIFYETIAYDRSVIALRQAFYNRMDTMKSRIAAEQRTLQSARGKVFCSEDGLYPEGALLKLYEQLKLEDPTVQELLSQEKRMNKELAKAVQGSIVFTGIFESIKGVGPRIAAPIITSVGDIRLFANKNKLKAFLGVHLLKGGEFPRKRRGVQCNWNPNARQALYLLGDQFNRRPDTYWGKQLRRHKAHFREVHPEVEMKKNRHGKMVKCYTDIHIHKMATWRTLTRFVEFLFREWTALDKKMREEVSNVEVFPQNVSEEDSQDEQAQIAS